MNICITRSRRSLRSVGQRGFTLLELMVVLAISTILAFMAAPSLLNTYRRAALKAEGRRLYGAFVEAQGLAAAEGKPVRLFLDRGNGQWRIEMDRNEDGNYKIMKEHPKGAEKWPAHVSLGPQNGVPGTFPSPYNSVTHTAWCHPCGSGNSTGTVDFDIDGRVLDASGTPINGAIMLHDNTGELQGTVQALVFIGATGDVRLFEMTE